MSQKSGPAELRFRSSGVAMSYFSPRKITHYASLISRQSAVRLVPKLCLSHGVHSKYVAFFARLSSLRSRIEAQVEELMLAGESADNGSREVTAP
jgi:hypothetical protein